MEVSKNEINDHCLIDWDTSLPIKQKSTKIGEGFQITCWFLWRRTFLTQHWFWLQRWQMLLIRPKSQWRRVPEQLAVRETTRHVSTMAPCNVPANNAFVQFTLHWALNNHTPWIAARPHICSVYKNGEPVLYAQPFLSLLSMHQFQTLSESFCPRSYQIRSSGIASQNICNCILANFFFWKIIWNFQDFISTSVPSYKKHIS